MKAEGKLLLASASPRRQELLELITADFTVVTAPTDETVPAHYSPQQTVLALAERKARAVAADHPTAVVIGADTVVAVPGQHQPSGWDILGKPRDTAHAAHLLSQLSGRRHQVHTGVAVVQGEKVHCFASMTEVEFLPLSEKQIAAYVATGEPMDKAGAYGIQGKGGVFIRSIVGDYYTVVGLPVSQLAQLLAEEYGVGWCSR